mmetsp:Transcript_15578/g.45065  ORF Transcript_15578/g.45065 Transcript_15578/m.45065 type:complete len:226 (+) Transcript_15578:2791-3468(+)
MENFRGLVVRTLDLRLTGVGVHPQHIVVGGILDLCRRSCARRCLSLLLLLRLELCVRLGNIIVQIVLHPPSHLGIPNVAPARFFHGLDGIPDTPQCLLHGRDHAGGRHSHTYNGTADRPECKSQHPALFGTEDGSGEAPGEARQRPTDQIADAAEGAIDGVSGFGGGVQDGKVQRFGVGRLRRVLLTGTTRSIRVVVLIVLLLLPPLVPLLLGRPRAHRRGIAYV